MKPSELLRRAAEILFETHTNGPVPIVCCSALYTSWRNAGIHCAADLYHLANNYLALFKPAAYDLYWWGNPMLAPDTNERVFALLLAAEIAESEGN
jgi:hypothetical protein